MATETMTTTEYLLSTGHNSGGRCEMCWKEAGSLYAGGMGAYESKTKAYFAVLARYQSEAVAKCRPAPEPGPDLVNGTLLSMDD